MPQKESAGPSLPPVQVDEAEHWQEWLAVLWPDEHDILAIFSAVKRNDVLTDDI